MVIRVDGVTRNACFQNEAKMTLNDYIVQNAGREQSGEFLKKFGSTEIFFSIEASSEQLKDGPLDDSADVELRMQTAQLEIGPMALFYTSKGDPRLDKRFGGIPLLRAAEMACNMEDVKGMLIQSDRDAWFAADVQALKSVLGQVRAAPFS